MELKLDGITKEFHGFTAVDQVSCRMRNGVYGLLGVNGAGKTTLMNGWRIQEAAGISASGVRILSGFYGTGLPDVYCFY